jgi:hypothetical protein
VPLADVGGSVAAFSQALGDGRLAQGQHAVVDMAAELGGVFAGLQTGPRRTADRLAGEGMLEARALGGEPVEIRGDVQRLTVAAAGVPALLVAEQKHDVGRIHFLSPAMGSHFGRCDPIHTNGIIEGCPE